MVLPAQKSLSEQAIKCKTFYKRSKSGEIGQILFLTIKLNVWTVVKKCFHDQLLIKEPRNSY